MIFDDLLSGKVQIPTKTQKGGQPQPAARNNNPGNLEYRGQPGAVQNGRFAKFPTPEAGILALHNQVQKDQQRGLTLKDFVAKYAPAFENNTAKYTANASKILGLQPTEPLSKVDPVQITKFLAQQESGTDIGDWTPPPNSGIAPNWLADHIESMRQRPDMTAVRPQMPANSAPNTP